MSIQQVKNENTTSANNFILVFPKYEEIQYMCRACNLPGINLGVKEQPTPFIDVKLPGDTLIFDPLMIEFIVDEDWFTYESLYDWMVGLSFKDDRTQYDRIENYLGNAETTDATLYILSNNKNIIRQIDFEGVFPIMLDGSPLQSNVASYEPMIVSSQFMFRNMFFRNINK